LGSAGPSQLTDTQFSTNLAFVVLAEQLTVLTGK
jgi:hypothetical protein